MAAITNKCPKLPWMINFFSTEDGHIPKHQLQAINADERTEYLRKLDFQSKPLRKNLTRIFCTIGPKSSTVAELERMIDAGMCVARIRMPYFTLKECEATIKNIRTATDNYSKKFGLTYTVAIALDLRGPEIRTGMIKDGNTKTIKLIKGHETVVTSDPAYGEHVTSDMIYVNYSQINEVVEPGERLFMGNDVTLSAVEVAGSFIKCFIERAGNIADHTVVRLESSLLALPPVDIAEVVFAAEVGVDMVIVSSVKDKHTIQEVKRLLLNTKNGNCIQIISKIEGVVGVKNIEQIVKESDGIVISRSNLEEEIPMEKLFLIQKKIIATCNKAGKPVIIAPQMLESMTERSSPTKAEMLDVSNAVLDGADGLLLSRETAAGENVCETIRTLCRLCLEAETAVHQRQVFLDLTKDNPWPYEPIYALAIATVEAAAKCNAACIILLTHSGRTAKVVAKYRPRCPIVAITRTASIARKIRLYRGIESIHFVLKPLANFERDVHQRVQYGITYGKYCEFIKTGDTIIVLSGTRPGTGFINSMAIYYASEYDTVGAGPTGKSPTK